MNLQNATRDICRSYEQRLHELRLCEQVLWEMRDMAAAMSSLNQELLKMLEDKFNSIGGLTRLAPQDFDAPIRQVVQDQRGLLRGLCKLCSDSPLCKTGTGAAGVDPAWDNVRSDSSHHSQLPLVD
jgi:hypothetical protein